MALQRMHIVKEYEACRVDPILCPSHPNRTSASSLWPLLGSVVWAASRLRCSPDAALARSGYSDPSHGALTSIQLILFDYDKVELANMNRFGSS